MKLSLGFSPCPNDTFIFDALVNNKIDTEGLEFDVVLEDVQTLNHWALEGKLAITKLSYGVLPLVLKNYVVLNSGSALGKGVGPLLISPLRHLAQHPVEKVEPGEDTSEIEKTKVAIPGENTTAHLLFSLAYPNAKNKVFLRYDEIENFVLEGKGLGVIIHENRFTYQEKGLKKVADLGEYWENETGMAIPLGGIIIKRSLAPELQQKINRIMKRSVQYAMEHPKASTTFVKQYAQEMEESVMQKHIGLYVNQFTQNLGEQGKEAIQTLYKKAIERNVIPDFRRDIFVESL